MAVRKVFHKTPLQMFVEAWVKQNRRIPANNVTVKQVQKAETLIEGKLGYCCDQPNGTLDLHTPSESLLTRTVKMFLNTMTKAGNEHSLEVTKDILNEFELGSCAYCD